MYGLQTIQYFGSNTLPLFIPIASTTVVFRSKFEKLPPGTPERGGQGSTSPVAFLQEGQEGLKCPFHRSGLDTGLL